MTMARIAGVQMIPFLGERERNWATMAEYLHAAQKHGAKLAIFPEAAVAGYCFTSFDEALAHAETVPGPTVTRLAPVCRERGIFAILGTIETDGARLYNTALLMGPEGLVGRYRKTHLPFLGVDRFTTPGNDPFTVFDLDGLRVGMLICYDGSFPEASRCLALAGADLIALPTNWPPGGRCACEYLTNARALENHVYFAAVNRVGEERGFKFIGGSRICDPTGATVADAPHEQETVLYADLDLAISRQKHLVRVPGQHEIDRFADRRPDLYGPLTQACFGAPRTHAFTEPS